MSIWFIFPLVTVGLWFLFTLDRDQIFFFPLSFLPTLIYLTLVAVLEVALLEYQLNSSFWVAGNEGPLIFHLQMYLREHMINLSLTLISCSQRYRYAEIQKWLHKSHHEAQVYLSFLLECFWGKHKACLLILNNVHETLLKFRWWNPRVWHLAQRLFSCGLPPVSMNNNTYLVLYQIYLNLIYKKGIYHVWFKSCLYLNKNQKSIGC